MKASEIQELLGFIAESGLDEVNIETSDIKLKVRKNTAAKIRQQIIQSPGSNMPADSTGLIASSPAYNVPQPQAQPAQEAPRQAEPASSEEDRYVTIKSPMIGTFYRAPNPDAEPFLQEGDSVKKGQTVCIVEAMKLFNEIEAEHSGKVVKIMVEDASPVEYDQPLFMIDPS